MTARENELADRCAYLADEKHTPLLDIEREELRLAASTLRANAERIKALESVIEPWAKAAEVLDHPDVCDGPILDDEVLWAGQTGNLTARDFRRARAARSNPRD